MGDITRYYMYCRNCISHECHLLLVLDMNTIWDVENLFKIMREFLILILIGYDVTSGDIITSRVRQCLNITGPPLVIRVCDKNVSTQDKTCVDKLGEFHNMN